MPRSLPLLLLALLTFLLLAGPLPAQEVDVPGQRAPTAADLHLFRHREIQTARPFAFDVDEQGVLWQGCMGGVYAHDSRTGRCWTLMPPELKGKAMSSISCFQGKLVIVHQDHPTYSVVDPASGKVVLAPLPGEKPNVWYMAESAGKLLLFDRSDKGGVLILDGPEGPIHRVPAVNGLNPSGGREIADGMVLMSGGDSLLLQILDVRKQEIVDEIAIPYPDCGLSGRFLYDQKLYFADSAAGRLVVYSLAEKRWLEPIPTPDYRKVYGFIGGGFQFGSRGYFCLSTYGHRSRLDSATGKIIYPPNSHLGIDGKPYHFLDRFLVFDAATNKFEYLQVPPQADGYPLICYAANVNGQVYITGYVIPWEADGSVGHKVGDWLVWQSHAVQNQAAAPQAATQPAAGVP